MKFVCVFSLLLIISACGKKVTESEATQSAAQSLDQEFLDLVNNHRVSLGLRPILSQDNIENVATAHSKDMAARRRPFGHTGLSGRCRQIRQELGMGNSCAENVAMGQESASEVFKAWINSADHRQTLEGNYTHTGLGVARSEKGVLYWTQIFLTID